MEIQDLSILYTGTVIEVLGKLCRACGVQAVWVINLVEESIIEPSGNEIRAWRFSSSSLAKVRFAFRLHRDLGVNLAGITLALDLLEEIERLRVLKNS